MRLGCRPDDVQVQVQVEAPPYPGHRTCADTAHALTPARYHPVTTPPSWNPPARPAPYAPTRVSPPDPPAGSVPHQSHRTHATARHAAAPRKFPLSSRTSDCTHLCARLHLVRRSVPIQSHHTLTRTCSTFSTLPTCGPLLQWAEFSPYSATYATTVTTMTTSLY